MEGERPLVVTEEYERLGGKKLSLIDVLAQSVGFIGPVFSAAFIIPLIIGVNAAAKGAGTSAALAVLLAAVGMFAIGWIVAQYAKRIHAAGSLYDYVSNGLGKTMGAAAGWLYYGGTIILTTGLGVLDRRVRARQPPARVGDRSRPADLGLGHDLRAAPVRGALLRRQDLDARAAHAGADLDRGGPDLLHHGDRGPRERQRRREGVRPDAVARWVHRDPVRGAVRRADLRRVRDRGQPGRGDGRPEALDPSGGARRGRDRLDLLPDRRVRGGRRVRVRPVGHHEPGGRRSTAVRARRAGEPGRIGVLAEDPAPGRFPRHVGRLRGGRGRVHPRGVRDGAGPAAAGDVRRRSRSGTGHPWARSCSSW